jgi:NAD(P)-dependent dehydrogenase (short-subunit alcohol dehydrogenase family)
MFKLTHKKVVITGGCSGIGKSIALTFLEQGAEVHVIDLKAPAEPLPADITLHVAEIRFKPLLMN